MRSKKETIEFIIITVLIIICTIYLQITGNLDWKQFFIVGGILIFLMSFIIFIDWFFGVYIVNHKKNKKLNNNDEKVENIEEYIEGEDRCVVCGCYVPEGRWICTYCEKKMDND